MATRPKATTGVKMMYLIKRRPTTSREELIAHWFANHMPPVIARQEQAREEGRPHAWRYIVTLFDPRGDRPLPWDGVAQLWFADAPPRPDRPSGEVPTDSFQEKAEPYWPWPTREYVAIDGALPIEPSKLSPPFPCTRSGVFKATFLVSAKPGVAFDALFDHWLDVHVPNVRASMQAIGGLRYVVSHSLEPETAPYAGMAELYFPDAAAFKAFNEHVQPDGMEELSELKSMPVLYSSTEMVGIA